MTSVTASKGRHPIGASLKLLQFVYSLDEGARDRRQRDQSQAQFDQQGHRFHLEGSV